MYAVIKADKSEDEYQIVEKDKLKIIYPEALLAFYIHEFIRGRSKIFRSCINLIFKIFEINFFNFPFPANLGSSM